MIILFQKSVTVKRKPFKNRLLCRKLQNACKTFAKHYSVKMPVSFSILSDSLSVKKNAYECKYFLLGCGLQGCFGHSAAHRARCTCSSRGVQVAVGCRQPSAEPPSQVGWWLGVSRDAGRARPRSHAATSRGEPSPLMSLSAARCPPARAPMPPAWCATYAAGRSVGAGSAVQRAR